MIHNLNHGDPVTIFLVWPTPEALYLAATLCRDENQQPSKILETGQRSITDTLAQVSHYKKSEIVIFAPFVCNEKAREHLRAIGSNGGQIHWYGEYGTQAGLILRDQCQEIPSLILHEDIYKSPSKQVEIYLRYKITLAFLGDENGTFDRDQLQDAIEKLAADPNMVPQEEKHYVETFANLSFPAIQGRSAKMTGLKNDVRRVARSGLNNVLILGETGSGKEATAFFLHNLDPDRRDNDFRALNCAGLQEDFLISELFGHVKGAYTGAGKDRNGLITKLDGGTLFLDELPDMPLRVQAMLLRFLESGEYVPMGSDKTKMADVKIIAGGQRKLLAEKISAKQFRAYT